MYRKFLIYIFYIISFFLLLIVAFASFVYLYENKDKIIKYLNTSLGSTASTYNINKKDLFWAQEILKGGYILHFRHAERDKWIDVQMYDALESDLITNNSDHTRFAENDYFSDAVCLNERGKVQASVMGEHIKNIGLPIGIVVSSVSCRARQTAELAFGGYDTLHKLLVHSGPYNEDSSQRITSLKRFYSNLQIEDSTNTIVSAHNSVVFCEMFQNSCNYLSLEEGGFYIISQQGDELYLEHEFHNYNDFNRNFYIR